MQHFLANGTATILKARMVESQDTILQVQREVMVSKVSLQNLGSLVRERRGDRGLREVAREIDTSPATLSRVEGGKLPDLTTFAKLCRWLEIDPSRLLGVQKTGEAPAAEKTIAVAHLRAQREISPATSRALARVIIRAQQMLADVPEDEDGEGI